MLVIIIFFAIEAILLVSCLLTHSNQRKIWGLVHILTFVILVALMLTSTIEWNFRWIGLFGLLFFLAIRGLRSLRKSDSNASDFKIKRVFLKALIIIISVFLIMIPALIFPEVEPLHTTGPYSSINVRYTLTDPNRIEEYTGYQENRKINLSCWYPQQKENGETFPLVIFSHGGLGTEKSNESLFLELASHGYILCSIGHTYQALWTKDQEGSITLVNRDYFRELMVEDPQKDIYQSYAYYQKWMQTRTGDINFVLDGILQETTNQEDNLFSLVNVQKISLMGHSLGGSAALAIPRIREDIDVVIALESPYLHDIAGVENGEFIWRPETYAVPTLNIYSDSSWTNLNEWPQYKRNVEFLIMTNENIENMYFSGAGHYSLTDLSLASPVLVGFLEGHKQYTNYREYLHEVNQAILTFLDDHLKD